MALNLLRSQCNRDDFELQMLLPPLPNLGFVHVYIYHMCMYLCVSVSVCGTMTEDNAWNLVLSSSNVPVPGIELRSFALVVTLSLLSHPFVDFHYPVVFIVVVWAVLCHGTHVELVPSFHLGFQGWDAPGLSSKPSHSLSPLTFPQAADANLTLTM